ncbi:MAG: 30S ribosomal protein S16 [Blastochloris sp.]|nr:30S ribosomal protein S16 [Blastochloris sp.]
MVRIRLRRTGKTKQPNYRVVIADQRSPRDGRFIEIIGHYNPVRQPKVLEIDGERARYWLSVGAQPSETVVKLLKRVSVLDEQGVGLVLGEAMCLGRLPRRCAGRAPEPRPITPGSPGRRRSPRPPRAAAAGPRP